MCHFIVQIISCEFMYNYFIEVAIDQISKASLKRASVSTTKLFDCCYKYEKFD